MTKEELQAQLDAIYHRTPRIVTAHQQKNVNEKRLMALADVEGNPLWESILEYIDEHARNALHVALGPGRPDGERQYGAGYAASAEDLACALRDIQFKAATAARALKDRQS